MTKEKTAVSDFSRDNTTFKALGILAEAKTKNRYDKGTTKRIKTLRDNALYQLARQIYRYSKEGYCDYIVCAICKQKVNFILSATSKSEFEDILKPSEVKLKENIYLPIRPKYHVEQEELLMWSKSSLKGPLNDIASKRFFELGIKYIPDFKEKLAEGD